MARLGHSREWRTPLAHPVQLKRIEYKNLKARQKENFNYQKVSAILADYGFVTLRLTDDWQGADFIAQHVDGKRFLRVQLKSRLTFRKEYQHKELYIAFGEGGEWYLYPHDDLLQQVLSRDMMRETNSWKRKGGYSFPRIPKQLHALLEQHRITGSTKPVPE